MSSSNQPPRMVNFPSLLVSEEDEDMLPANPDGSTVHSWINADFVPSWLRPFTLDQNTRFTRTPDHLLRPPEETQPEPLPSYGTAGASWHFLEMPLDIQDDAAPIPSVKADIAALEQAFADLPALRAARESTQGEEAEHAHAFGHHAEGWSVDEQGRETVLSWQDLTPAPDLDTTAESDAGQPQAPTAGPPAPEAFAQEAFAQEAFAQEPFAQEPFAPEQHALGADEFAGAPDAASGGWNPEPVWQPTSLPQQAAMENAPAFPTADSTTFAAPPAMAWSDDGAAPPAFSTDGSGVSASAAPLGAAGPETPAPADMGWTPPLGEANATSEAPFAPQDANAQPDASGQPAMMDNSAQGFSETPEFAPAPCDSVPAQAPDFGTAPVEFASCDGPAPAFIGNAEFVESSAPDLPVMEPEMSEAAMAQPFPAPEFSAPVDAAAAGTDAAGQAEAVPPQAIMDGAAAFAEDPALAGTGDVADAPAPQFPEETPAEMVMDGMDTAAQPFTGNTAFEADFIPAATHDPQPVMDAATTPALSEGVSEPTMAAFDPATSSFGPSPDVAEAAPQDAGMAAVPVMEDTSAPGATMVDTAASDTALAMSDTDVSVQEPAAEAGSSIAAMAELPASEAAAPSEMLASDEADQMSEAVDGVPLDGTLAQLAAAALEGATAFLDETPDQTAAADPLMEDLAPAHLRPLTRMIVVGRLALPEILEQDLAPIVPEPLAPEADAAARAADLIHAHFAWQPYHLSINGSLDAPAEKGTDATAEPSAASAPEATAPAIDVPAEAALPALATPAGLPAVVDPAHDPFAYHLPPIDLLGEPPQLEPDYELSEEFLDQSSAMLQQILRDFGIRGEVIDANPGPVVTLYEFEPAPGVKSSRVIALAADIARSMSAVSARVAVVEGRNVIGIELPNRRRDTVWLRELLASHEFEEARTKLGICLGKTIGGVPVITDLARMPHLLVAGTTGSGKSVAINTMILSLLYRHTPEACRLIMIDPKMLELSVYEGIPHLLTPVVTDPKKAIIALKWAVKEMEDRYRKMARLAVRNIDGYNARMAEAREKGEVLTRQVQVGFDKESGEALYEEQQMDLSALPYIVIIVDEMADLMMVAGKEIEGAIQRLAQMARAAGIHLVMATQRPSVDVITGTIKANFPTRISFQVTSKIDSRTILGEMGAETLLGQGDMLFMAGGGRITRVHGPFVSDQEVEHVVAFLKAQGGPEYLEDVVQDEEAEGASGSDDAVFDKSEMGDGGGDLYEQAVAIVLRDRKASTSYIQRRLQVGYNKAASLMERMEAEQIVGPANHAGKREILSFGRDRDDDH
ncbi:MULTISPECIES: DNA translocase FtsK [unclassified Xanthobacter]|uniref:DNA translocase FtsK n=1 Tax=unclassified Xanthobacter TaxID=2623496 RepID=UPI003F8ED34B